MRERIALVRAELEEMLDKEPSIVLADPRHGDVSLACHQYSRNPALLAKDIADKLNARLSGLASASTAGGYVNIVFDSELLAKDTLADVFSNRESYGRNDDMAGRKAVIDYSAPNIGKPLHVGHIRSTILGDSLKKIFDANGFSTYGINYLGDTGLHLGKLIAAFRRWGSEDKLKADPEREMLELYVRFGKECGQDKSLDDEAHRALIGIENNEPDTCGLLERLTKQSLEIFHRTYDLLGVSFDEITGQRRFSSAGISLVNRLVNQGIAHREKDGGIVIDLEEYGLPPKVVLRSDGTPIYSTQDLAAAEARHKEHAFDKMIYVVASEQSLYFRQLFAALKKAGHGYSDNCHHLSFGLISLKDSKMSSREGNVVFLHDVLSKAIQTSRNYLASKGMEEGEAIARQVGVGAIKYMVLSVDPLKDLAFSWERALDFNGRSSPYIQYANVRCRRLLDGRIPDSYFVQDIKANEENSLVRMIARYPLIVSESCSSMRPNKIANFAFSLAQSYSSFYTGCKIIGSREEETRLALSYATGTTLSNAMGLLGIEMPERM
jgi:arginyl-tRNA synthetase